MAVVLGGRVRCVLGTPESRRDSAAAGTAQSGADLGRASSDRGQVLAALRARGLVDQDGPRDCVVDAMRLLRSFSWSVDLRLVTGHLTHVIGAVAGQQGVLCAREGDEFYLASMPDYAVVPNLVR